MSGSILWGSEKSCVAVCTLWSQTSSINVPEGSYAVKGNLYSGNGINAMLRTLLEKPDIRYIILCGNDRTGSGDDLKKFFSKGLESNGHIADSRVLIDEGLREFADGIRKHVEFIDMRNRESEVAGKISGLEHRPPWREPVKVPESAAKSSDIRVMDAVGFRTDGKDISRAWLRAIDTVMKFGEYKKSEHDVMQKEVLNIMAVVEEEGDIEEWLPFTKEDIEKYYETFFGTGADKGLSYTYGKRLFEYISDGGGDKWRNEARSAFNQIETAMEHLRKAPHTRRAAAFTWYVKEDSMSESPPCLTQITWNIKYGKLFQTAVFRSHDMFRGWPMNAFALRELQKRMANELGVTAGKMTIISNSAHIYENNFSQAEETLKQYFTCTKTGFVEDMLGYFIISLDNSEIRAQYVLPDHTKTDFVFRGKKAEDIYKMIAHEGLVSRLEHAAYLGSELARAEEALKTGKEYVQDGAA